MKVVVVSGGFDPIHSGHIFYLIEAKKFGDRLIVALNSDEWLIKKKVKNLIKGYETVKKVSIKEKKSLNILCRGAAMRYFLTRLFDYSNTPKSALIKIKDPREYYQKLVIHNNLKTYKDYLK